MAKKATLAQSQKKAQRKSGKKLASGLTAAQEKFAARLAAGDTQREAYNKAYPSSKKWKPSVVDSKACNLAKHDKVKARIEELTKKAVEKAQNTAINEASDVIKAYQRLATASITDFIEVEVINGVTRFVLKDVTMIDSFAIKSMKIDQWGNVIVELFDKKPILDKLAEIYGINENQNSDVSFNINIGNFDEEYKN